MQPFWSCHVDSQRAASWHRWHTILGRRRLRDATALPLEHTRGGRPCQTISGIIAAARTQTLRQRLTHVSTEFDRLRARVEQNIIDTECLRTEGTLARAGNAAALLP